MRIFVFVSLVCLAMSSAQADEPCRLERVAALPLGADVYGGPTVPVTLNGLPKELLVDTGGATSFLSSDAADALNLTRRSTDTGMFMKFGARWLTQYVIADSLEIGKLKSDRTIFFVLPPGHFRPGQTGTLGQDILEGYDDELDFAGKKFNLFHHTSCAEGAVVYWTNGPYAEEPLRPETGGISLNVILDGKSIVAYLDTGAPTSYITLEAARTLFGIDEKTPGFRKLDTGKNDGDVFWRYPFGTLDFGGVGVTSPNILVVPSDQAGVLGSESEPRMLIGASVLSKLHLFIAYGDRKLYATAADAH